MITLTVKETPRTARLGIANRRFEYVGRPTEVDDWFFCRVQNDRGGWALWLLHESELKRKETTMMRNTEGNGIGVLIFFAAVLLIGFISFLVILH